ncbi:PqqD family protein [Paenibacillus massiliensis]|uniref:PqqD family protein n=1 Tax=Paenibacillus massiliensis TaxID=225917 RepID=UPI0003FA9A0C|nr:PqqD family protein [Paenibacillus massiliensis]
MDKIMSSVPRQSIFVQCRVINNVKYIAINREVFELDEVGELVWESINGEKSISDIIDKVSRVYDVVPSDIRQDIEAFINELIQKNLVEV